MGNTNPPKLLDQVRQAMPLRHSSLRVGQSSYAHGIMCFACHSSTAPHNKVSISCALDEITVEAFVWVGIPIPTARHRVTNPAKFQLKLFWVPICVGCTEQAVMQTERD
jgi:hypothetical protein